MGLAPDFAVLHPRCEFSRSATLSSSGLTGRSSTPRLLDSTTTVSGILDPPLSRVMTTASVARAQFPKQKLLFQTRLRDLAARFTRVFP
jgi:hypothetical protein